MRAIFGICKFRRLIVGANIAASNKHQIKSDVMQSEAWSMRSFFGRSVIAVVVVFTQSFAVAQTTRRTQLRHSLEVTARESTFRLPAAFQTSAALMLMSARQETDEALLKRSGCQECHSVDKKVIGPAFRDIAERYRNDARARTLL